MKRHLLAISIGASLTTAFLLALHALSTVELPVDPPRQRPDLLSVDNPVRLDVEYDESFLRLHGSHVEDDIREIIAIHNIEWRRYRNDWFVLGELKVHSSGHERDASHVLANFLRRTEEHRGAIHVNFVGRALEVYPAASSPAPIGGLAFRGSDALLVSATSEMNNERIAYYLFHEIGHCFETLDLPFSGGDTTYGSHRTPTFRVDAGNEQILRDSRGPSPRATPMGAAAVIEAKLARAESGVMDATLYEQLHDVLLHEPSPANAAYLAKKNALLEMAGGEREAVQKVLEEHERSAPSPSDSSTMRSVASHYWRIDRALLAGDTATARSEWQLLRATRQSNGDVAMLIDAIGRRLSAAEAAR